MVSTPTPNQTSTTLFQPAQVGDMLLKHRIVMAPLTRMRATAEHVPLPIVAEMYAQRASIPGTLLISEATLITHEAGGYSHVPGIWSDEQIASWKEVTNAVHAKGSYIYLQLWALGRTPIPASQGVEPDYPYAYVSASDIPLDESPYKPRPLTVSEIQTYIRWYVTAAKNAVERAGFDGVEVHGAHGFLPDQFLQDVSNVRVDSYGGSIENRTRFALEVVDAVAKAVGPSKTGIRISPWTTFHGMKMKDPKPTFAHLVQEIKKAHPTLAYIHVVEPRVDSGMNIRADCDIPENENNDFIREIWTQEGSARWLISAGGHDRDSALKTAEKTRGDLVAFGRPFIANPDLPYRLEHDIPLIKHDRATFYMPNSTSPAGYTDYPFASKQ